MTRVPIEENARNQLSEAYTTGQKTNYDNASQGAVWRGEGQTDAGRQTRTSRQECSVLALCREVALGGRGSM